MWPVSGSVKRGAFHGFGLKWSGPMPRPTTRSTASAAVSPANPAVWRVPRTRARRQATAAATAAVLTAYRPIAQGALTGKYKPGEEPPAGSRAASSEMGWAMDRLRRDAVLEAVQRLRPIADGLGLTMAQLALAWVLREPNLASAIVGASRPEQLEENAAASGVELGEETLAAIDEALVPAAAG